MSRPKDEFDDAFFDFVGEIVYQRDNLIRALEYIKEHLGQVCPEFEICSHPWCNSSCTAWLISEAALSGNYDWPSATTAPGPPDH